MGRKSQYSKEMKLEIVKKYLAGESPSQLASDYGMYGKNGSRTIREWRNKYEVYGESAFNPSRRNKRYPKALKLAAIKEYLKGYVSYGDIVNKYEISSKSILINWVKKYNCHIGINDYDPKAEVYMAKARKTTHEERIEIVKYCLEHNKNYTKTAFNYGVNYAQVYAWVRKFKEQGEDGLQDGRGRKKPASEMTESERLHHENKKLKAKNLYLEMENEALKKWEEIERRSVKGKHKNKNT